MILLAGAIFFWTILFLVIVFVLVLGLALYYEAQDELRRRR